MKVELKGNKGFLELYYDDLSENIQRMIDFLFEEDKEKLKYIKKNPVIKFSNE